MEKLINEKMVFLVPRGSLCWYFFFFFNSDRYRYRFSLLLSPLFSRLPCFVRGSIIRIPIISPLSG